MQCSKKILSAEAIGMGQQILLNLGLGDWQTGFENVTAQLWTNNHKPVQFVGSLPPAIQLANHYRQWQKLYKAIHANRTHGHRGAENFQFNLDVPTNISEYDLQTLCSTLQTELKQWLLTPTFAPIEQRIRTHLVPHDGIRVMLTAHDKTVLQFPWQLWSLFEDYSNAELSLSLSTYSRALKKRPLKSPSNVKILAILGNDDYIDVETDRQILGQLPWAKVTLLAQPTLADVQHQLWESCWDILFFAGHSASQGQGYLRVNATETLTIEQLKYALRHAIANGLQLAILNSCDGLGLACKLADLHLPQAIVMREPVPDIIAHQFLKGFLTTFVQGKSLYNSVREAREKLHGLSKTDTCAAWLPVIVQNPAEEPPTWPMLTGRPQATLSPARPYVEGLSPTKPQASARRVTMAAIATSVVVLSIRWLGFLQGVELWAYDTLMRSRPLENPDNRLVVVTVNERDIHSQTSLERRGSLSDETLQQALETLSAYQPRVIGLDIYRDFPASTPRLANSLAQPGIVGICKSLDPMVDNTGIGQPPEMGNDQVGFSDFLEDSDGVLRRQILSLQPDPVSPCVAPYGFATLVAMQYLRGDGAPQTYTATGNLKLGETVFPRLRRRTGGLQPIDNRGNQLLINYRSLSSPDQIAAKVPLQKLLDGQVNPESLRDRIVLIGVTAPSGDYWTTIYGKQTQNKPPGVFIQAQMVSQLISTVLDDRPLIWVWPQWAETSSIISITIISSLLTYRRTPSQTSVVCLLVAGILSIGAWTVILIGGWLPLMPALIGLGGGALATQLLLNQTD